MSIINKFLKTKKSKRICASIALVLAGVLYYLQGIVTNFYVHCPIKFFTGLDCPGCGITRMFIALFQLDLAKAASANLGVFILAPVIGIVLVKNWLDWINDDYKENKIINMLTLVSVVLLLAWGVVRNLSFFVDIYQKIVLLLYH